MKKKGIFPKSKLPVIIFDDFTTSTKFVDFPFKVKSSAMKILLVNNKEEADIFFIYQMIQKINFDLSTHKRYWISEYSKIKIPLPPLKVQKEIVQQIEKEERHVESCKELIKINTKKIQKKINEVWKK